MNQGQHERQIAQGERYDISSDCVFSQRPHNNVEVLTQKGQHSRRVPFHHDRSESIANCRGIKDATADGDTHLQSQIQKKKDMLISDVPIFGFLNR